MKKVLLIALALIMVLAPIARAEGQEAPMAEAQKSFQPFELDGEEAKIGGYLINANNYYKLRDLAALLNGTDKQFNIVFDDVKKQIALELGKPYEKLDTDLQEMKHDKTKAKMVTNTILVDGKEVELKAALIDRNNYVKLRDLGPVVGFIVDYNRETKAIIVDTKSEAKAEEKAEEKTEDKKEEKSEDKKPEEKKVEKKDQVKTTDPNATAEEIKAFLADPKLTNDYSLSDGNKLIEKDGVLYLSRVGEDGDTLNNPIAKYVTIRDWMPRFKAQTKFMDEYMKTHSDASGLSINYNSEIPFVFLKDERFDEKNIETLNLINYMKFKLNDKVDLGFGIDNELAKLHLVFIKDLEAKEPEFELGEFGNISVMASYDDGSVLNGEELGSNTLIPRFHGENKAKLRGVSVLVMVNGNIPVMMRLFII